MLEMLSKEEKRSICLDATGSRKSCNGHVSISVILQGIHSEQIKDQLRTLTLILLLPTIKWNIGKNSSRKSLRRGEEVSVYPRVRK